MKNRRILMAAMLAGVTALATPIVAGEGASASTSDCGSGKWCLWYVDNYSGAPQAAYGGNASGYAFDIHSYYNNGTTGRGVKEWKTNGALFTCVLPLYGYGQVSNVFGGSHQWNPTPNGGCNF
jgi:hypothetical protein